MAKTDGNLALSVLLRAVDHISAPVRRMQGRLGALRRQVGSIGRTVGFDRLTKSLTRAGKAAGNVVSSLKRVGKRLALIGSAGVAAAAASAVSVANVADATAKTADKLGIGIERLQELRYAAESAGLSSETLDMAMQRFVRRISDAAKESGPAVDALKELGLSAKVLATRTPDQALASVADALMQVERQSDRVRLAFALFDSGGVGMVNMLKHGSIGLDAMYERARELGFVLSEDAARAAEDFSDQLVDMKKSLLGVRNIIGAAFMPVFGDLLDQLTVLVVRYQPQIRAWAQGFARELPARLEALKKQFVDLAQSIRPLLDAARAIVDRFGAVRVAAVVLGAMIAGPVIVPLIRLGAALVSVGAALARVAWGLGALALKAIPVLISALGKMAIAAWANPIVAIVGAIAIGAALIIANWDRIGPWFKSLWANMAQYVASAWQDFAKWLGWDPLTVLQAGWAALSDYFGQVMGAVKRLLTGDWTAIKSLFKWSPLGLVAQGFDAALSYLGNLDWRASASQAWDRLKGLFKWSPLGLIAQGFDHAFRYLADLDWRATADGAWQAFKRIFSWTPLGQIRTGFESARQYVRGLDWVQLGQASWSALKALFSWSPLGLITQGFDQARQYLAGVDWAATSARAWEAFKRIYAWSPLGLIKSGFDKATRWLSEQDWTESGKKLLKTLADGIKSMAAAPVDAVRGALSKVRDMLPFSDARTGPLSALTASGAAIPATLAKGVQASRPALIESINSALEAGSGAITKAWSAIRRAIGGDDALSATGRIDARLGSVAALPALQGRAVFEAELVGMGKVLEALNAVPTRFSIATLSAANEAQFSEHGPVPAEPRRASPASSSVVATRAGVHIGRIDLRPQFTIKTADGASAQELVELVDERLERLRNRDMWEQVQSVREAG